jgi:D-alanyl-D-alanine carboxypeptidase
MSGELAERLTDVLHKYGLAGAVAGVSDRGTRTRAAGGWRHVERREPMTAGTPVRIASVTKPIVAASVVLAARETPGLLDRPVISYLPELRASWRVSRELTLRSLLSQSAGLFAEEDLSALLALGDGPDALLGAARLVVSGEQVAPPGSTWAYYSGNFWLAGAVLARVRECTFEAALAELVLDPAGLVSTGFETPSGGALGHSDAQLPVTEKYLRARRPGGGLWSTVDDLLSFAEFLLDDGDLLATVRVPIIEAARGAQYGLGWYLSDELILHPGGLAGFGSLLVLVPERRLATVIVLNQTSEHKEAVTNSIVGGVLQEAGVRNPWPA